MDIRAQNKVKERFGAAVRSHRSALGLSQEKLAELADLHRTYIADIERGTRNVGLVNIVKIAMALKVGVGDLISALD